MKLRFWALSLLPLSACGPSADEMAAAKNAADIRAARAEAQTLVDEGKRAVSIELADRRAAQFRGLKVNGISLCGEYAAKSSGADVAFDKFMYAAGSVIRASDHRTQRDLLMKSGFSENEIDTIADDFDKAWRDCQDKGEPMR